MNDKKIRYYESFDEDFFQKDEVYKLEKDYEYIQRKLYKRVISSILYAIAFVFSSVYCRLFLHVRFVGTKKIRDEKGGFFLYGNHTQPIGDVFNPALACFPKRIYTVVSPANLHLPVIGKLIRPLGALPLPNSLTGMKNFNRAVEIRIKDGHPVVIYPEAHLWDYYTDIRPFREAAFTYATRIGAPVYCFTSTYQKRKIGKKPRITIYIDGPFSSDAKDKRERAKELCSKVWEQMKSRAELSDYEYIKYVKKETI